MSRPPVMTALPGKAPANPRRTTFALGLVAACLLGVFIGRFHAITTYFRGDLDFATNVDAARELILNRFVDPPTEQELLTATLRGMAASLNDPYSTYIAPEELEGFSRELLGRFVGIGVTIRPDGMMRVGAEDTPAAGGSSGKGSAHIIISPLLGSPAAAAGLLPGDRVIAVAGQSVIGIETDRLADLLRGESGTQVEVVVERQGASVAIKVMRADVVVSPVTGVRWDQAQSKWDYVLDNSGGIGYVHIDQFSGNAAADCAIALAYLVADLEASGSGRTLRGLILDLRGNPGGLLEDAAELADMFLDSGLIVSIRSRVDASAAARVGPASEELRARVGMKVAASVIVTVLVDEASASASEVVAGALAEQQPPRARLAGARSFGKGLVQVTEPLPGGGLLKLTEQFYFLPSGKLIQRRPSSETWGVQPDVELAVEQSLAERWRVRVSREALCAIWPANVPRTDLERALPTGWPDGGGEEESRTDSAVTGRALAAANVRDLVLAPQFAQPTWVAAVMGDSQLARALLVMQSDLAKVAGARP